MIDIALVKSTPKLQYIYIYISEKCAKNYKNLPLAVNGSFFPSCQLQIV